MVTTIRYDYILLIDILPWLFDDVIIYFEGGNRKKKGKFQKLCILPLISADIVG
jgi:hypothetical protein